MELDAIQFTATNIDYQPSNLRMRLFFRYFLPVLLLGLIVLLLGAIYFIKVDKVQKVENFNKSTTTFKPTTHVPFNPTTPISIESTTVDPELWNPEKMRKNYKLKFSKEKSE